MRVRRLIAAAACCMITVSGLSACGKQDDPNHIEFMTGMSTGTAQLEAMQQLVDEFEEENPGVTINLIAGTTSYEQDLRVRLAGRNAPDIWNTHGWSRDRYANFLEPLQTRDWADDVNPLIMGSISKDDGSFYALPLDVAVTGIFYNEEVLEAAGVDPEDIQSWDDFSDACAAITETGATCLGASGKDNYTAGNIADYMLPSVYADDELDQLLDGTFVKEPYIEMADILAQWRDAGYFNIDYSSATFDDLARRMAQNELAFLFNPNGGAQNVLAYNPDAKLGFMPYPSAVGDPYLITGEDYALGVSKDSAAKENALKFIDFMAEPEHMQVFNAVANNAPALTTIKPEMGVVQSSYDKWVTEKGTGTTLIFDRVYLPNGMWNTLITTTDSIINGQVSSEDAAQQMETSFISLYRRKS